MKMKTFCLAVFVSLISIGKSLQIGTWVAITTGGLMLSAPQEAKADIVVYMKRAHRKSSMGDFKGAIADFTKAINMNSKNSGLLSLAYEGRALNKLALNGISDKKGICFDLRQASSLGSQSATSTFYELCDN